jgi:Zn-dependent peptidase ImmA (M78 family)
VAVTGEVAEDVGERQADEFAAAFLMPRDDIDQLPPLTADWRVLMDLKASWGVSIAALLMRARRLKVMGEGTYVSAAKVMSARGWRRHEPVDGTPEFPVLLKNAMARTAETGLRPEDLRRRAAIPKHDFRQICELIEIRPE